MRVMLAFVVLLGGCQRVSRDHPKARAPPHVQARPVLPPPSVPAPSWSGDFANAAGVWLLEDCTAIFRRTCFAVSLDVFWNRDYTEFPPRGSPWMVTAMDARLDATDRWSLATEARVEDAQLHLTLDLRQGRTRTVVLRRWKSDQVLTTPSDALIRAFSVHDIERDDIAQLQVSEARLSERQWWVTLVAADRQIRLTAVDVTTGALLMTCTTPPGGGGCS